MKIIISTKVKAPFKEIVPKFNQDLFKQLTNSFPRVIINRFDGNEPGSYIDLTIDLIFTSQNWISLIKESSLNDNEYYFVDEGIKLPFFLKKWKHKHKILDMDTHRLIIDEIHYGSYHVFSDILLYPILLIQFAMRKPVYKKIFN